ncbi:50S ribosomal protein L17 [bacterium]|nr:50S ribosomal protein L17 [bacterium]
MRHRKQGRKLNRTGAHRLAMLRNMTCNLFNQSADEGKPRRITTTIPKAKETRRMAEKAITLGKRGTLHARRQALALLQNKRVVKTLFEDIAPLYIDRPGGYTRIMRLEKWRLGDGADLCYLELVGEPLEAKASASEPIAPRRVSEEPEAEGAQTEEAEAADDEGAEAVDEVEVEEEPGDEETKPESE